MHKLTRAWARSLYSLVGVCVVHVVLDPPWLEGEDERCEHERAHNVLNKPVLVEAAVASIVTDNKELAGTTDTRQRGS